jgi:hypothetical protein
LSDQSPEIKPPVTQITLGKVLGWAWAVVGGIGGIAMLWDNAASALLIILSAAIALPPANAALIDKFNVQISGIVRLIIIVILVILAGSLLPPARIGESNQIASATQPSATSAPTPGATSAPTNKLFEVEGNGAKTTQSFTTPTNEWMLWYTYDCSSFGARGNFIVNIKAADGSSSSLQGVNELGAGGGDKDYYHQGGTFYLEVNSECWWHIEIWG